MKPNRHSIRWRSLALLLAAALLLPASRPAAGKPLAATTAAWRWPTGKGLNSVVYALAWDGSNLYVGGNFTNAGGDNDCDQIGRWTGSTWDCPSEMNINGSTVFALLWDGTYLYAGGIFSNVGGDEDCDGIARWTGSAWDCPPGMALNFFVNNIVWDGSTLYAGGYFTDAGGDADCDGIARWTGSAWDCPSGMALGNSVEDLLLVGSNLYAGGAFTEAGGDTDCNYVGRWTGSSWNCPEGMALNGVVESLAWDGSILYAGGGFINAGGDSGCDGIGRWTGFAWDCPNNMAPGGNVNALFWDGNNLYAGGTFANAGGDGDCDDIGIWIGSDWDCPSGMAMNVGVYTIMKEGSNLYAGGGFTNAGGDPDGDYIAAWALSLFEDGFESGDFSAWSSFNDGSGDLTVGMPCAMEGTYGMCAVSNNNKRKQVIDSVPDDEAHYYASFLLDHNNVDIGGAVNRIRIFQGRMDANFPFIVLLRDAGSSLQLMLRMQIDAGPGNYLDSAWYTISDGAHTIGVDWQRSSGANDGWGNLLVDGVRQGGGLHTLNGVDNDTLTIRGTRLGITTRMDAVVLVGTLYFDDFYSDTYGYP